MAKGTEARRIIEGALALGFTPAEALLRALDSTASAFAGKHGHQGSAVSMCLNFYGERVFGPVRDDLAADLELPREYIDGVIERARKGVAA